MNVVIIVATVLLAAGAGIPVAQGALKLATRREQPSTTGGEPDYLRGGLMIGVLERLAVAGTILLGHPEGVAVVVAVKGLGRFPELRNIATNADRALTAAASERFIIGTLTSLVWSAGIAAAGLGLLELV